MKILHISYIGRGDAPTGLQESILSLSYNQRNLDNDVKIISLSECSKVDNINIIYCANNDEFKKTVFAYSPDIVVFHSLYEWKQIVYSRILRKFGIPYLLVFHGGASSDNAKKKCLKKRVANFVFFNKFIKHARRVVYLNEGELKKSVFHNVNNRYVIIPNGVNLPIAPKPLKENSLINIAFVSRMDFYGKGLDVLFPAIKKLREEGWADRIKFIFYGLADHHVSNLVAELSPIAEYGGFVIGNTKRDAFENAHINILPSRSEGMPMTVLESLSYGRPCIVTKMTNMADLIEECGCGWVIDLTEESIVATIKYAYYDLIQHRNVYYERCINLASRYSWLAIAKKTIEMYATILQESPTYRNGKFL